MILPKLIENKVFVFVMSAVFVLNPNQKVSASPENLKNVSAETDYFRSITNGDWNSVSTWQSSPDNTNWFSATSSPNSSANTITIQAGNIVGVTTSISLDQTIINGVLEIRTNGVILINDGAGNDITINNAGILRTFGTSNYTTQINYALSANINILPGGKITIGDGTTNVASGFNGFATDGKNTWNAGSVFEWNNTSAFTASNVTYFPNASTSNTPILRITKCGATAGGSSPLIINGLLEVNYSFSFGSSGTKTFRDGIIGTAALTLGGTGTLNINSSSAILGGSNLTLILNKTLNANAGLSTPAGANIKIDNASTTGINVSGGNYTIAIGATFDIGASSTIAISSNNVIVNGIFRTANINGLSGLGGTSVPSGNIILNSGSTVEYYSSSAQKISIRTDYYNLVLSGGGTKTPAVNNSITPITGTVTIPDNTVVDVGNNTFGSTATKFTMLAGRFRCSGVNTKPDMNDIYTLSGGVVEFYNSSVTPQSINSKQYFNIEVTGSNVRNSNGNLEINNGGSFTVKSGGVFSINDEALIGPSGIQTVTIENGGTFKTGDPDGFSGGSGLSATSIRSDIENIILAAGSTVEFDRSASSSQFVTARNDYYNLTLSGVANKTFTGNCSVAGNFVASGGFVNAPTTMNFTGISGTQNIAGLFYNSLVFSGSAAKRLTSDGSLNNTLFMNGNNVSLDADGVSDNIVFTLKSTPAFTARINDLTNSGTNTGNSIAGNVTVERYIPAGRKWRFLNVPFNPGNQTINQAWQEGQTNTDVNVQSDTIPGYGTEITYDNNPTHGFDVNNTLNPSLKTWDYATKKWSTGAPYTNATKITDYAAFCLFVRGSRAVNLSQGVYANQDATTLRARGVLKQGNVAHAFSSVTAGDLIFIGNPYPSSVNLQTVVANNSAAINPNIFYVWDPKISGNYGVGAYVTYSSATGWSNISGSYNAATLPVVQGGQAFFLVAASTSGNINFKETDKTATEFNVFGKPADKPVVYVTLNLPLGDTVTNIDGVAVGYGNQYSNDSDAFDAKKLFSFNENISLVRNGQNFSIEARPVPGFADTLFLNLFYLKQQQYNLRILPQNLLNDFPLQGWLVDKYIDSTIDIDMSDTSKYNFSANSDTNSYKNRFMIVFKRLRQTTPYVVSVNNAIVKNIKKERSIDIYPNPASKRNPVSIKLNNFENGEYEISISDIKGHILQVQSIQKFNSTNTFSILPNENWLAGNYVIKVSAKKNNVITKKILIR